MKIGIISDTHCWGEPAIPDWVKQSFEQADLIIHAGDIENEAFLQELGKIAPVYAVKGNCDFLCLPEYRKIKLGDIYAVVAHKPHRAIAAAEQSSDEIKLVISGHTHIAQNFYQDGRLFINPGSPRHPRGGTQPSVALVFLEGEKVRAEIITPGQFSFYKSEN